MDVCASEEVKGDKRRKTATDAVRVVGGLYLRAAAIMRSDKERCEDCHRGANASGDGSGRNIGFYACAGKKKHDEHTTENEYNPRLSVIARRQAACIDLPGVGNIAHYALLAGGDGVEEGKGSWRKKQLTGKRKSEGCEELFF